MMLTDLKIIIKSLCLLCLSLVLECVRAEPVPEINAAAYVVADQQSQTILASRDLDSRIEPAALTKLMTTYLVFQALQSGKLKPESMLTLPTSGWQSDGSRIFMQPDVPMKAETVIQGMLTISANDAAITLATAISGSEKAFVRQMNEEVDKIGLKNTHFINCTGQAAEGQYSSVGDLLQLAQLLIQKFPQYQNWFAIKSFTNNGITQLNRNLLLFRDDKVDGLAVGYTINGGYNLAVSSKRNGRSIIAILVGTDSSEARAAEGSKLISWALTSFNVAKLYDGEHKITDLSVYKGDKSSVPIGFIDTAYVTQPSDGAKKLKLQLEAVRPVVAPIRRGLVLGTLKLINENNQVVAEKDVVALEEVKEARGRDGWFNRLWYWFTNLFA